MKRYKSRQLAKHGYVPPDSWFDRDYHWSKTDARKFDDASAVDFTKAMLVESMKVQVEKKDADGKAVIKDRQVRVLTACSTIGVV